MFISFVYVSNLASKRKNLWKQLVIDLKLIHKPGLVTGDFNVVLRTDEKRRTYVEVCLVAEFNNCILSSGLLEAVHTGLKFTWRSCEMKKISSRLDRALGNQTISAVS